MELRYVSCVYILVNESFQDIFTKKPLLLAREFLLEIKVAL